MPDITTVSDRKVPTALDPECTASAKKGHEGIGMNEKTYNEGMAERAQQVDVTE